MKNYLVKATRNFHDLEEHVDREKDEEFECTKERYEYLKSCNGAVELINVNEVIVPQEEEQTKKTRKSKKK